MKKNDFWFFSLIALLVVAISTGWNLWLRIAIIANSILVFMQVVIQIWKARTKHG